MIMPNPTPSDLVERLRDPTPPHYGKCQQAADLITQQAAEIERLRAVLLQIGEMQPCHCARCTVMGEVARKAYRSEGAV